VILPRCATHLCPGRSGGIRDELTAFSASCLGIIPFHVERESVATERIFRLEREQATPESPRQGDDSASENAHDENLVDCPDCLAAEEPAAAPYTRPKLIENPGDINTWPGLVKETPYRHMVDRGATLAYFKLPQETTCSLGPHHPKEGSIVNARCGAVLRLGWQCASKSVRGYEDMRVHEGKAARYFTLRAKVRRIPEELCVKLTAIVQELEGYELRKQEEGSTPFGKEMIRRANGATRDAQVALMGNELRTDRDGGHYLKRVERNVLICGLAFWKTNLDVHIARGLLEQARQLDARSHELPELADDDLTARANACDALEINTRGVEEKVRLGRSFWAESNLEVARLALSA
jgi:hypothetical protein